MKAMKTLRQDCDHSMAPLHPARFLHRQEKSTWPQGKVLF